MWRYIQTSGDLFHEEELITTAFSGDGIGLNNPKLQHIRNVGPIPQGPFLICQERRYGAVRGFPLHSKHLLPRKGPFWIHAHGPSHGCIIVTEEALDRIGRLLLKTRDYELTVLESGVQLAA